MLEDGIREDFEKCCKMRIWTRKSASIQPRTSVGKSDGVVAHQSCRGLALDEAAALAAQLLVRERERVNAFTLCMCAERTSARVRGVAVRA